MRALSSNLAIKFFMHVFIIEQSRETNLFKLANFKLTAKHFFITLRNPLFKFLNK